MKAFFKSVAENRALVSFDNACGDRVTLELFASARGGYVKIDDGKQYPQICEGLCAQGPTLEWRPSSGPLVDTVRKEYSKRQRANR